MRKLMMILAALLLAVSCTVKEDRSLAPCWLTADISGCDTSVFLRIVTLDSLVVDTVDPGETPMPGYPIKKGPVVVSVVTGCYDIAKDGIIPITWNCPPVYLFREALNTEGLELATTVVKPGKQYCDICFYIPEVMMHLAPRISVQVISSSAGYDLKDLSVIRGNFSETSALGYDGQAVIRVPRQAYDDLHVLIYKDGFGYLNYNLSEVFKEYGYDWGEYNLKDMKVQLPVGNASGVLVIGDWSPQGDFDERI